MTEKCLKCGSEMVAEANFCRRCGAHVGAAITARAAGRGTAPARPVAGFEQLDTYQTRQTEVFFAEPAAGAAPDYDPDSAFAATEALAAPGGSLSALLAPTIALPEEWAAPQPRAVEAAAPKPLAFANSRKWLALAAPALLLVIASGLFFLFNSSQSSAGSTAVQGGDQQAQTTNASSGAAGSLPVTSAQPAEVAAAKPPAAMIETKPASVPHKAEVAVKPVTPPRAADAAKPAAPTATAHTQQGTALLSAGNYQGALREFEQARRFAPGNKDIYYLIGQTHHQLGQLEQALQAYRQCTAGVYAAIAQNHVAKLEKKLRKSR